MLQKGHMDRSGTPKEDIALGIYVVLGFGAP